MQHHRSFLKELVRCTLLISALILWVNMGEGEKNLQNTSKSEEPHFAPLEEGAGSISGMIYDDKTITTVKDLSFFGNTKVGGLRKESDDSFNQLELPGVKEIQIITPNHQSTRYKDKDFALIKVKMINGKEIPDLLAPRHIVICGIEQGTKIEKAWFLNMINKIVITSYGEAKEVKEMTKEVTTEPAKKDESKAKKEFSEDKDEVKKKAQKIEQEAKDIIKNVKDIKATSTNPLLPEEQLPRTLWEAFVNILDSIINFFKVIIKKIVGIFGY